MSSFIETLSGKVIVVHSLYGNQVAIATNQITTVSQVLSTDSALIFISGESEPVETQESWEEVMSFWTGQTCFKNSNKFDRVIGEENEEKGGVLEEKMTD